jgi:hypothetical protein
MIRKIYNSSGRKKNQLVGGCAVTGCQVKVSFRTKHARNFLRDHDGSHVLLCDECTTMANYLGDHDVALYYLAELRRHVLAAKVKAGYLHVERLLDNGDICGCDGLIAWEDKIIKSCAQIVDSTWKQSQLRRDEHATEYWSKHQWNLTKYSKPKLMTAAYLHSVGVV